MSILNAPAEIPNKSRPLALAGAALAFITIAILWYAFRYYPEKMAAEHFFNALVAGDTNKAYQLWKPGPNYTMKDFLADWGPEGYYGPVKSYDLAKAKSEPGWSGVVVQVKTSPFSPMPDASDAEKSRKTRVVSLWVESKDKSLSFPP